jgi:hypothetical protein
MPCVSAAWALASVRSYAEASGARSPAAMARGLLNAPGCIPPGGTVSFPAEQQRCHSAP